MGLFPPYVEGDPWSNTSSFVEGSGSDKVLGPGKVRLRP